MIKKKKFVLICSFVCQFVDRFESNTEVKVGNNHVRIPYSGPDVEIEAMLGHMVQVTASFGMVITMSFKTARLYIKLLPEHQEQVWCSFRFICDYIVGESNMIILLCIEKLHTQNKEPMLLELG